MEQRHTFQPHFSDTKTENEKLITDQLTRALTILNLQRVNSKKSNQNVPIKSNRKDYLYVCLTGLPPLPTQFQGIGIPGEKIVIYPQCFQPQLSEEQAKSRLPLATLEKQAQSLHFKIKDRKDKAIVFVFHSFGTSIMSTFFRLYYKDYFKRIIGIIAIGFYPITPDPWFKHFIMWCEQLTREQLLKNADQLYQKHKQFHKSVNLPVIKNKYANVAYLTAFGQGLGFSDFFTFNRRWYPLLKCFIYGRQDNRLSQSGLNEAVIYYSHKRTLAKQYQSQIKKVLKTNYDLQVDNVQQRFIYNIDGGKHSIHLQKKFKLLIADIINEYLSVIQQVSH